MTKKYIIMVALLGATAITKAQDTYLNDRLTATDDITGSARYVGMGGAIGALGADISVMSSNPAGIGLFRKSEIGLTFGGVIPYNADWKSTDARTYGERLPRGSFDQIGFIWCIKTNKDKAKFVNFGINYQKKADYNYGFYADNLTLNELSQMDPVTELAQRGCDTDWNLAGLAADVFLEKDAKGNVLDNAFSGERSAYTRHQRGLLHNYDMNISFNVNDRFYTGLTFGVDAMKYMSWSSYSEQSTNAKGEYGDYTLYNDREINGVGLNMKWGAIVRPIADNPLRMGFAVETPTRYNLKNSTLFDITNDNTGYRSKPRESYLEYTVRTPWRTRISLGSTVDNILAWGLEYEYANTAQTKMGYPGWGTTNNYPSKKDIGMNALTKNVLRAQHTVKAGIEVKPNDAFAVRVGYNFVSSRYKDNPTFDQYDMYADSYAMDYTTSTDYMTLGATNIVTFGVGYKYKKFYADLAYKYRMQSAKFYAFDTSYASPGEPFAVANPALAGRTIEPVDLSLNRHQIALSMGFKF